MCDGEYHCSNFVTDDKSDEALGMCKPKDTLFQDVATGIVVSIFIIGMIVFFSVRYAIRQEHQLPDISITETSQNTSETLINICSGSN